MPTTADLELALGHRFREATLLRLALTHSSIAHELGAGQLHNQRLEFLGDAVLQLVVTSWLYERYPDLGEGPLTQARAEIVNRMTLAKHGHALGLGAHLILSRGEETSGGRDRPSTVADALEAVIGAVFVDAGYDRSRDVVLGLFHATLEGLAVVSNVSNPKGQLQELLQASSPEPPRYSVVAVTGPEHNRVFECTVHHLGRLMGRGSGRSKKLAEGAAALDALQVLQGPMVPPGAPGSTATNPTPTAATS
ncbi:MAG: ribonuclease III [Verrucomicrobiota bacterium]|jgi:ribonuclease-3